VRYTHVQARPGTVGLYSCAYTYRVVVLLPTAIWHELCASPVGWSWVHCVVAMPRVRLRWRKAFEH
jgi:hypothetical protein